jgi:hypothetical protein
MDILSETILPRKDVAISDIVLLEVAEILEIILLQLDHCDIIRAQGVCRFWRNCITGSRLLMTKIYKLATLYTEDDNPHFETITEQSLQKTIPLYRNRNLWQLVRKIEDKHIRRFVSLTDQEWAIARHLRQTYESRMWRIRWGFQGIRFPNGWPEGLRELHCDLCDGWHTDFRFENLHPLLQFLEDASVCFRGHGTRLMMLLCPISEKLAPKSCFEHSCAEIIEIARHLRFAYDSLKAGGVGGDFCSKPTMTKIVTNGRWAIEDAHGLTIKSVVPFLFKAFHFHVYVMRRRMYQYQHEGLERIRWDMIDTRSVFPSKEKWKDHIADFPCIITLWEEAIAKVNEIMRTDDSYIAMWKPITKAVDEFPYKIIEQILAETDFQSVIRAQRVCKKWLGVVLRSRSLQRIIYKLPITCDEGYNPHYEEPTEASLNVTVPGGKFSGERM